MAFRLQELADRVDGVVDGDPDRLIEWVAELDAAGPTDLGFLIDPKNLKAAAASRAGALVVPSSAVGLGQDLLRCEDPALAMAVLLAVFQRTSQPPPGVHPTAVVGADSRIAPTASIGPYSILGESCSIGDECVIDGHVTIGSRVEIGRGSRLHPQVSVYDDTRIGKNVTIHSGTVVGADGLGYLKRGEGYRKVPQIGRVCIEDDVEIGANSAIDRGTLAVTRIGRGTKIDNLVQIGHNVDLGTDGMLCALSGIAGSATIGKSVVLAGQAGIIGHVTVGDGVTVAAKSAILSDTEGGQVVGGFPAIAISKWRRLTVLFGRLDELHRRIQTLERRLHEEEGES